MKRCTLCVLSERFPGITFDKDGVCNHCHHQMAEPAIDLNSAKEKIEEFFHRTKGTSHYDAVVCYSGGKDSTYTLQLAVQQYGLRVLAFTFDNGFLSEGATANINNVVESLGVDLIRFKANQQIFNKMVKLAASSDVYPVRSLTRASSICQTCINLINLKALDFAIRLKAPAIIAGFTLGQIPKSAAMYEFKYSTIQEFRAVQNQYFIDTLGPSVIPYLQLDEDVSSLDEYPKYINLMAVQQVDENTILAECDKLGWVMPQDTDGCSSNCCLNGFANIIAVSKHGFHPYEAELSCLVRNGLMQRQDAMKKLEQIGSKSSLYENAEKLEIPLDTISKLLEASEWKFRCRK